MADLPGRSSGSGSQAGPERRTPRPRPGGGPGAAWKLYRRLVEARIRSDWQYRASFTIHLVSQALVTGLELVALLLLLRLTPTLGGWSTDQVVFLYAMAAVPFALVDAFVSEVERLPDYVRSGDFDQLLLRPVPAMVQMMAVDFELRRLGKLLPVTGAMVWAVANVEVAWQPTAVAWMVLYLSCGFVLYSALWVAGASVAFWTVASAQATNILTYGGQFANEYPLHLYPGWIRAVMGFAIPLAFVAYIPTLFLLDAANPLGLPSWAGYSPPVVAALAVIAAAGLWSTGIRHYQSTGS